jgi:hypothetical protein
MVNIGFGVEIENLHFTIKREEIKKQEKAEAEK